MWVYLNELLPENMVEFGHVLPKPGAKSNGFWPFPGHCKITFASLGTDEAKQRT
jgi:hypothetical protein